MSALFRFPRFFVTTPSPCPYLLGKTERKVFTELNGPHAGELNDALKYLTAAAEKLPDNSEIQDHLGDVHARRGALPEAIAAWTKALAGSGQGVEKAGIEKKISDARAKMQNAK